MFLTFYRYDWRFAVATAAPVGLIRETSGDSYLRGSVKNWSHSARRLLLQMPDGSASASHIVSWCIQSKTIRWASEVRT